MAEGERGGEPSISDLMTEMRSLKRTIAESNATPQISERGKQARLQPGEFLKQNGTTRGYNRALAVVEEVEAVERLLPPEGESLPPERVQDVREAIKKGAMIFRTTGPSFAC